MSVLAAKTYEYRFVRLGDGPLSGTLGTAGDERAGYEHVVHEHARDGWRLVQVLAPAAAAGGARYCELIFERERFV